MWQMAAWLYPNSPLSLMYLAKPIDTRLAFLQGLSIFICRNLAFFLTNFYIGIKYWARDAEHEP